MVMKLEFCLLEDIASLTPIYMLAFNDPISYHCFPRSRNTSQWWTRVNEQDYKSQPAAKYLKVVAQDGTIVAYGKWNVPTRVADGTVNGGDDPEDMPEWPIGGDKELSEEFFETLARKRLKIMDGRPHYYLEIVATLPDYQGLGAARQIIQWGLEQADRENLEAYVEAGPGLIGFYQRFGWRVVDRFIPSRLEDYEECMMVRAQKAELGASNSA